MQLLHKFLGLNWDSSSSNVEWVLVGHLGPIRCILSHVSISCYIFRLTLRSLSDVSYSDECRTREEKSFHNVKRLLPLFSALFKFCSSFISSFTIRLFIEIIEISPTPYVPHRCDGPVVRASASQSEGRGLEP